MDPDHPINPTDSMSEREKIVKLREILAEIFDPNFSTLGHGTSPEIAQKILADGLQTRDRLLDSTAVPLLDSKKTYQDQPDEYFKKLLNWGHRDYKAIVVVMIPNPKEETAGGRRYFDSVFEELPPNKQISVGISGADRCYSIPPRFIKGYVDINNLEFVRNDKFNPPEQLETKKLTTSNDSETLGAPNNSNGGEKNIPTPPTTDSNEIW